MLQLTHLELSSQLIAEVENSCQLYIKHTFSGARTTHSKKELGLRVIFHNGWKAVSQSETVIKEKENQIVPTQNSMADEMRRGPMRESALGKSKPSLK